MEYLGIGYIVSSNQRLFWIYIISSLIIAFLFIYLFTSTKEEYKTRKIWLHSSALLDYKYFFVISFIKVTVILPLILSSKSVALWSVYFLQENFGYVEPLSLSKEFVVLLYTVTLFVIGDFTRYWLHRALHTVPFLWKIHQVHHSAEVLNPLTFYRVHPIENIFFGLRYSLSVGVITGIFLYFFGAKIGLIQIAGANLFVFIFGILGSNLRHSHIPLRYGDSLEKIFISPFQHQLHHSKEFTHKNFGGSLALWDWIFHTLHIQNMQTNLCYGIKGEISHKTVLDMLLKPITPKFTKGNIL